MKIFNILLMNVKLGNAEEVLVMPDFG